MNRPTKISLVSSIFVIIGLCGSLSHAAPQVKNKIVSHTNASQISNQIIVMTSNSTATYSYAYPSYTSEVFIEKQKVGMPSISTVSRQPLLGMQVADFANINSNKSQKKNTIFEFAAKFNDKLQQVLSFFDFSSASTMINKENTSEVKQQRKIHVSSNIANCIASKK